MSATANEDFLPYNLPDITDAEIEAVADTLRSGWLAPGPRVKAFEADFASFARTQHAIAVDSATAGLHLALIALGIGPGDEVITTPTTFVATVNTIIHTGATPVLADIEPADNCIDAAAIERAITPRTRAIMPVHHAGAACDMTAIGEVARRHGLRVIEDAAHALGTEIDGVQVGGFSDLTVFSFYPTKNVTTARGGMITTNDDALAQQCRLFALHGMSDDAWDRYTAKGSWAYRVTAPGYNYAMSDYQAALGHVQFGRLPSFQAHRRALAAIYNEAFDGVPELVPPRERAGTTHAWHLYVLKLATSGRALDIGRDEFIVKLRERGIGTSVHFIPVHHHPYYRETYGWAPGDFPAADAAFEAMLSLPLYTRMSEQDARRVADAVIAIVNEHRN